MTTPLDLTALAREIARKVIPRWGLYPADDHVRALVIEETLQSVATQSRTAGRAEGLMEGVKILDRIRDRAGRSLTTRRVCSQAAAEIRALASDPAPEPTKPTRAGLIDDALKLAAEALDHVPMDCWSNGPSTGNLIEDYVVCPGCRALAAIKCAVEADQMVAIDKTMRNAEALLYRAVADNLLAALDAWEDADDQRDGRSKADLALLDATAAARLRFLAVQK